MVYLSVATHASKLWHRATTQMEPKSGNLTRSRSLKQTDLEQLALLQRTEVHCGEDQCNRLAAGALWWKCFEIICLGFWLWMAALSLFTPDPTTSALPHYQMQWELLQYISNTHIYANTNIQIHGFGTLALNRYQMQRKLLWYISPHSTTLKIIRMHLS